ncbi:MAG TPA: hypothetical protein VEI97_04480, partial [bacterium]|nr:hypothetical protein [bacterium]
MTSSPFRLGAAALLVFLCAGLAWGQGNPNAPQVPGMGALEEEVDEEGIVEADRHFAVRVLADPLAAVRQGQPFPVVVEVEAFDQHLRGTLEVAVPGNPLYRIRVDVAAPSLKRFVVTPTWFGEDPVLSRRPGAAAPVAQAAPDIDIVLRSGARIRYRHPFYVTETSYPDLIVGEITGRHLLLAPVLHGRVLEAPANGLVTTRLTAMDMDQRFFPGQQQPVVDEGLLLEAGLCSTVAIPDGGWLVPEAYAPYDIVVLHETDPRNWDSERRAALQSWVLGGGVVLAWPAEGEPWDPLFPLGLGSATGEVGAGDRPAGDTTALADFTGEPFKAVPTLQRFPLDPSLAPVVIAADGQPLLGVRRYGRGALAIAAIDLGTAAMRDWNGVALLLGWMANWGLSHSVTEVRAPGLAAASLMAPPTNNQFFGAFGRPEMADTAANATLRLGLTPLAPAAPRTGFSMSRPLMGFMGGYLALVLLVFPLLRRRGMWTLLWSLWGVSVVVAGLAIPALQLRTAHLISRVPIANRDAPTQVARGEAFIALRGSFDGRVRLREIRTPRQLQSRSASAFSFGGQNFHPLQLRPYLNSTDYVAQVDGTATTLEHVELPLWSRRAFFDLGPAEPPAVPFEMRWAPVSTADRFSRKLDVRCLEPE